ncbi:MAG: ABC transporter permease [Clostridiales Family XIII bacterium]|jgi:putative ABC transport system permease protein|nr:ABC transporter permease [Clostridiales Family XIII bacterium]
MIFLENIRLALSSLVANKLRALLTMLGIIIGISAVVAIVTVGDAMTGSVNQELQAFGGNNITVGLQQKKQPAAPSDGKGSSAAGADAANADSDDPVEPGEADLITPAMVGEYHSVFASQIKAISTSENLGSLELSNGKEKASVLIYGVNADYPKAEKLELVEGRMPTQTDMEESRSLAWVDEKFVTKYWGPREVPKNAIGKELNIELSGRMAKVYVAGVYRTSLNGGYSWGSEDTTKLLLPISLGKKLAGKPEGFNSITIMPATEADDVALQVNTDAFFSSYYTQNRHITAAATSNESYIKSMNKTMNQLKLAISAIAAISLLVGGIGVMNIMMVSVTERTREIGVRMALGAKGGLIRFQFVVEAIVICLIGGFIGVLAGIGLGIAGSHIISYPVRPSASAIVVAVSFSAAIGLFFGWYPAEKAARLDPIDALRYE